MDGITLRPAQLGDIAAVAGIFARSRAVALPFVPVLHSGKEDIVFFTRSLETGLITLAETDGATLGFIVETEGWIEQLYLEPNQRGRGIGRLLVDATKSRHERLQLWCFRDNLAARDFYTRLGFIEVRHTDGDNEEGLPDILFAWDRRGSAYS